MTAKDAERTLVTNRRAGFDFHLDERFEAGVALVGSEVKSLRAGKANLQDAWIRIERDRAVLVGCHISPYEQANRFNHDPVRERPLLLRGPELARLWKATHEKGRTVVPTRVYLKGSWVKVEIAVATGKRAHDKRAAIKEREAKAEIARHRR